MFSLQPESEERDVESNALVQLNTPLVGLYMTELDHFQPNKHEYHGASGYADYRLQNFATPTYTASPDDRPEGVQPNDFSAPADPLHGNLPTFHSAF